MRIIFDKEKNLEYIDREIKPINEESSEVKQKINSQFVNLPNSQYIWFGDKILEIFIKMESYFPIGTIFSTLYNLSVIEEEDLKKYLIDLREKNIEEMNSVDLLSLFFLNNFGEKEILEDLARSNIRSGYFKSRSLNFRNPYSLKMIPKNFNTLSQENKLLLIKVFNPTYSIEKNTQVNKDNYVSNFFCIISYFLLSFIVSYIYFLMTEDIYYEHQELKIDDVFYEFVRIVEREERINIPRPLSDEHSTSYNKITINKSSSFYSLIEIYVDLYKAILFTLDFTYPENYEEITFQHFSYAELLKNDMTIASFINKTFNSLNKLFEIYNTHEIKLSEGTSLLPLVYTFSRRNPNTVLRVQSLDPLIYAYFDENERIRHRQNERLKHRLSNIELFFDNNHFKGSNLNWDLLYEVLKKYHNYDYLIKDSFFNTQIELNSKSQDINPKNPINITSKYTDILFKFLISLFNKMVQTQDPLMHFSNFILEFYQNNFEYFCILRDDENILKFFPNKNLIAISCNNLKDLLSASFYGAMNYGKFEIKNCRDRSCPCVYLATKDHDTFCDFHKYLENTAYKHIKNNYSKFKQQYDVYVRNISVSEKIESIFKKIDNLANISNADIAKIKYEEKQYIVSFLKFIIKNTYSTLLKSQYDQIIKENLEKLPFQFFSKRPLDNFAISQEKKKGYLLLIF